VSSRGDIYMAKKVSENQATEDLKVQLTGMESQWKRALADYQNLEKRIAQQQQQFVKLSTSGFILKLLPVIDHLRKAAIHLKDQGLDMIVKQLEEALETEDVKPIKALGTKFNHLTMEAVEQVEGEKEMVIEEVETGYMIGDQVLKPAKVKVGVGVEKIQNPNSNNQANSNNQNI
jgi:molecular chaperone GrpE